eukprot:COSAG06_NODE_528_length_14615_cov_1107.277211_11_plen_74_part_00
MRCLSAVAASGVALIVAADASPILDQSTVDQVNSDPCVQLKTHTAAVLASPLLTQTELGLHGPLTGRRHGLPR